MNKDWIILFLSEKFMKVREKKLKNLLNNCMI
jgi:hypothetical protein